jgi:hypothetical protein
MLQFDAFVKEGVNQSAVEQECVRRVVVYCYVKDDTMQIVELLLQFTILCTTVEKLH